MIKKAKRTLTLFEKTAACVWVASVLLFAAGIFCLYMPQRKSLANIHQRYRESCEKANLAKEASNEKVILLLEKQTRDVTDKLNALTIPADRVSSLVFEVGRIANQLNLSQFASKSIADQSGSDKAKTKSKPVLADAWLSVEFTGAYQQFAQFVNLLERNNPAIFVEKVFITRGNNGVSDNRYELELSVLTTPALTNNIVAVANSGK